MVACLGVMASKLLSRRRRSQLELVTISLYYYGSRHRVASALVCLRVGISCGCLPLSDFLLCFLVKAVLCSVSDSKSRGLSCS